MKLSISHIYSKPKSRRNLRLPNRSQADLTTCSRVLKGISRLDGNQTTTKLDPPTPKISKVGGKKKRVKIKAPEEEAMTNDEVDVTMNLTREVVESQMMR